MERRHRTTVTVMFLIGVVLTMHIQNFLQTVLIAGIECSKLNYVQDYTNFGGMICMLSRWPFSWTWEN